MHRAPLQWIAANHTPEPCQVVVNARPRVALRHAYHPADERLQYDAAGELISSGELGQQGSKDGIGIQPAGRQNLIERAVRCEHLVPITPACDGIVLIAD